MSVLKHFRDTLMQRLQAILWRSMASDLETDAVLQDVENLNRIEQAARQYEAEGKPALAHALRHRADAMAGSDPGGSILVALENLSGEPVGGPAVHITDQSDTTDVGPAAVLPAPKAKRRRRRDSESNELPEG